MVRLLNDTRRWRLLSLAVLLLGTGWVWASRVPPSVADAGQFPNTHVGFPAPDFALETLDGATTSLAGQRGNVLIVNLWASWCGPCRAEMPTIQRLYDARREEGLTVLAVHGTFQDSEAGARAFAEELGLTFPIVLDRDGAVSRRYQLHALPSTFIVDRKGIIREVILGGPLSEATLQSKVDPLLEEAP
ncbi:MAG: TlpA family protein disulfide reductase [Chloroflexi bacterium SZAS-1]|nr:TlpA family protein disulfide reductase [Chloroflexi bacterium SZAS-1]